MTSHDIAPAAGDIWLAYVHFADHPEVGKVRPVVILEAGGDELIAVAAKVTSKNPAASAFPCFEIREWKSKGLRRPSYVRLDQRLLLPYGDLLRGEPLGRLSEDELREIVRGIKKLL